MKQSKTYTSTDILEELLEQCDNDLGQLIQGDSLVIPSKFNSEFAANLKDYLGKIVEEYREKPDSVNEIIVSEAAKSNETFFEWVLAYFEAAMEPMRETAFLKELNSDEFYQLVQYTLENHVLYFSGENYIDDAHKLWSEEKVLITRKLLFTIADMVILKRFSKNYFYAKVNELFNFDPSFADILWDEIVKHEDTLWKNLIYRHIGRIENKVEELSFLLTDED